MTDHNTMTIDQCRDEIGRLLGWELEGPPKWKGPLWFPPGWPKTSTSVRSAHPFDSTTDAALAAMPKGWFFEVRSSADRTVTSGKAVRVRDTLIVTQNGHQVDLPTTAWRLCVVAWRKEKGVQ